MNLNIRLSSLRHNFTDGCIVQILLAKNYCPYRMKIFPYTFAGLLLACQYYQLNLPIFLLTLSVMLAATLFTLRTRIKTHRRQLFIILGSLFFTIFLISHNADTQFGLRLFNSDIYPVSIQDYLAFAIAFFFGHLALSHKSNTSTKFIQFFACLSALLIAVSFVHPHLQNEEYPVYTNPNWSGTLILSFLLLVNNSLFHHFSRAFKFKTASRKAYTSMGSLLVFFVVWPINLVLLLKTGSRSATIAFLLFLSLSLARHCFLLFRKIGRKTLFWTGFIPVAIASVSALALTIVDSFFYEKIVNFMDASNTFRIDIYSCYLYLLRERPFLGNGIGRTAQLCADHLFTTFGHSSPPHVNHAHNFLLQIAADHGIFVISVVVILICLYVWQFFKFFALIWNQEGSEQDEITFHIYLTVFAIGLASLFQSAIYHVPFLAIWTGLLIGISSRYVKVRLRYV